MWEFDGRGRRIRQTTYDGSSGSYVITEDLKFLGDGWRHIAELNATNNALVRSYVWGLDLSGSLDGAGGVGGLLIMDSAADGVHFYAFDGNGNVAALVSAADGNGSANYEYDPFGQTIRGTGLMGTKNPFRFSTKRASDATGLVLYEYRVYIAPLGRWASRDPIEERGGRNLHAFVANRPSSTVDGLGRCGSCGEDVTAETDRTLSDLRFTYEIMWDTLYPEVPRVAACKWIVGLGPYGVDGARGAWSIRELASAGARIPWSGLNVGECRGHPTLTFQGRCHFAGAVNYAIFGAMMRLCRESAATDPGAFEGLTPEHWSLATAQTLVILWLAWQDHFPPWHEVVRDKLAFTRYGYDWASPNASAPPDCGDTSSRATAVRFHWWWHPAKWWSDRD